MKKYLSACDFTGHDKSSIRWYGSDTETKFNQHSKSKRTRKLLEKNGWKEDSISYDFNNDGFRDKEFEQNAICFFGCSIGFGVGVKEHDRFSNLIADTLGIRCNNLCIPGTGSDTTARIFPYWIEKLKPKIVVNHFMWNSRREYITGNHIWLWLVNERRSRKKFKHFLDDEFIQKKTIENTEVIKQCCQIVNVPYIQYGNDFSDNSGRDLIHPGPKAHQIMADKILELIQKHL